MKKLIAVEVFFRDRRLKEQVFDQDQVTIGRDPGSDVHLDNAGVSRLHATLKRDSNGVLIADAGSANGSLVNLMRVTEAKLTPTDNVQIGKFVLRVSERNDVRRAGDERGSSPQVPERETIRVDALRARSIPEDVDSATHAEPARAKNSNGLLVGALFVVGVAVGWAISRL